MDYWWKYAKFLFINPIIFFIVVSSAIWFLKTSQIKKYKQEIREGERKKEVWLQENEDLKKRLNNQKQYYEDHVKNLEEKLGKKEPKGEKKRKWRL